MNRKEHKKLAYRYLWARPEPLSFQGKLMKRYLERPRMPGADYSFKLAPAPPTRWGRFTAWYDRWANSITAGWLLLAAILMLLAND